MGTLIEQKAIGILKMYIEPASKFNHPKQGWFRRVFPKSTYQFIIEQAKNEGILMASLYQSHFAYSGDGNLEKFTVDGDNSKLHVCIELVDEQEKLERFYLKHRSFLDAKMVIFREAQVWNI